MHEFFARRAARELSHLPGVERIFICGSVANGMDRDDSDIDLAITVDDCYRMFPLTADGQPQEHQARIDELRAQWSKQYGVMLDIVVYWSSDLAEEIRARDQNRRLNGVLENARELYRELLEDD